MTLAASAVLIFGTLGYDRLVGHNLPNRFEPVVLVAWIDSFR
jgi:hypothetical protein